MILISSLVSAYVYSILFVTTLQSKVYTLGWDCQSGGGDDRIPDKKLSGWLPGTAD